MSFANRSHRRLRTSVEEVVEDLGPTVASIADRLADFGAQGRPGDEERCVLSSYLRVVIGSEPSVLGVAVRPHAIHVRVEHWRPAVRIPLSLELQAFIAAFDAGLYPGLVAEVARRTEREKLPAPS